MPAGPRPDPPTRSGRLAISGRNDDSNWTNVFWVHLNGSGLIPHENLVALADMWLDAYAANFAPVLSTEWSVQEAVLNVWDGSDQLQAISTHGPTVGEQVQVANPANVAACISWPIAVHYRGGHPRTYFAGSCVTQLETLTSWTTTFIAQLSGSADAFHTAIEATPPGTGVSSVEHGIISFSSKGVWRDPPVFRRIQQGAKLDSRVDTQRRRLGRDRV